MPSSRNTAPSWPRTRNKESSKKGFSVGSLSIQEAGVHFNIFLINKVLKKDSLDETFKFSFQPVTILVLCSMF